MSEEKTRGYRMNDGRAMTGIQRNQRFLKNLKSDNRKRVQWVISSEAHSILRKEADRLGLCMGQLIERLAAGLKSD